MMSKIKNYIKPIVINIGIPLATFLTLGIPLASGCGWEAPKKNQNLEQLINNSEKSNFLTREKVKELIFYSKLAETVENTKRELSDFSINVANYQMHNPDSARKFIYLAQAMENLLSVGQNLTQLQYKNLSNKDEKLNKLLYDAKFNQQRLMHEFNNNLRKIFTDEGVIDNNLGIEKYEQLENNSYHKMLHEALQELSKYINNKIQYIQKE